MYKEITITILIVLLILGLDIITNNYTLNSTNSLSGQLEELREEIKEKNTNNLEVKINEILSNWKKHYNVMAYYLEHDELEKVETELTMLKADIENKRYDECINEIDTSIFILKHIEDKEKFTIQSIF